MSVNAATFQMRPNAQGFGVPRELWATPDELTALGVVTGAPVVGNPVLENLAPSWNLPATINVPQSGSVGVRQYLTNGADLTISVTNLPTGVTYNSGTESLEGAASGTSSGTATFTAGSAVDTATVALVEGMYHNALFFDDFNYAANETNIISGSDNPFVSVGSWWGMKSQDTDPWSMEVEGKINGTLRTVTKAQFDTNTGTSAPWPGGDSAYALRMAGNNAHNGTDFYLAYGDEFSTDLIPANVYFQYWLYMNRNPATNEITAIETRHKMLYAYGAGNKWLFSHSAEPYPDQRDDPPISTPDPVTGRAISDGRAFIVNRDFTQGSMNWPGAPSDLQNKLGANLGTPEQRVIPSNEWVCMRIRFDTSDSNSGKFECWMRRPNQAWIQIARWIGGVYPEGFTWSGFAAGGHPRLRMPTTVGINNRDDGIFYYLRDWAMAGSAEDLPTYPDEP